MKSSHRGLSFQFMVAKKIKNKIPMDSWNFVSSYDTIYIIGLK